MQDFPVLYTFRRCPYAIRARMALKYADITCELREVVLRNKPQAMLNVSNKGTVPVLQLTDGTVIEESLDVMLWALEQADPDEWLNVAPQETEILINQNDEEFKKYLDRYKYFQQHPEQPQTHYRQQAESFLGLLETHLQKHSGLGFLSERISLVDIAIFPFIRQFAHVDLEWFSHSQYKYLISWLLKFESSELFLSVMQKYMPWQENQDGILSKDVLTNNQK